VDAFAWICFHKKHILVDEMRRFIEAMPAETYKTSHYYGKWAACILQVLLRKKVLDETRVHQLLFGPPEPLNKFKVGQRVLVKRFNQSGLFRRPHLRTPGYIFGKVGVIDSIAGEFLPPDQVSWNHDPSQEVGRQTVYRVRFGMGDIWQHADHPNDSVDIEIFQQWLVEAEEAASEEKTAVNADREIEEKHDHGDHEHDTRTGTEQTAIERETLSLNAGEAAIAEVLISESIRVGLVTAAEILDMERRRDAVDQDPVGPKVVAKAWKDAKFRQLLLTDAPSALKQMGVEITSKLVVQEDSEKVHNLIVCTLCSCYPSFCLGKPPAWYKSRAYRSRAVFEPRKVLKEFGTELDDTVSIRVHDSTADLRYMVLPFLPSKYEHLSEEELAQLVNRDHMIGVAMLK
jgi:nitrile hydratase